MSIGRTNADAAFSDAVRLAAKSTCRACGRAGRTECAHLVGRRCATLRWDTYNAEALCHTCHRTFTEEPKRFADWVEDHWPGRWDALHEKRRAFVKNNKATRDEVAKHYREQIRMMKADPDHKLESWI